MTAQGSNTGGRAVLAWVVGVAIALLGLLVLLWARSAPEPEAAPVPRPSRGQAAIQPVPRAIRASLPPPAGIAPPVRDERPEAANITPDDRRLMNFAVDGVLRKAQAECLEPWLREEGEGEEFVIDAVLYDGHLYDVGIRAMGRSIPADVLQCVADRAWYADWPEWDLRGELRLQRSFEISAP